MRYRHLILDRDGVLNEEAPNRGYVTSPQQWRWIPGALVAIAMLHRSGVRLTVATNQSGVGRGYMTDADLAGVHARMLDDVAAAGGCIAAVYVCPHAPGAGCECRKPAPGLLQRAVTESGIPVCETLAVGDDLRDLDAARAAGIAAVLVLTGKGRDVAAHLAPPSPPVYEDLRTLALQLLATGCAAGNSNG